MSSSGWKFGSATVAMRGTVSLAGRWYSLPLLTAAISAVLLVGDVAELFARSADRLPGPMTPSIEMLAAPARRPFRIEPAAGPEIAPAAPMPADAVAPSHLPEIPEAPPGLEDVAQALRRERDALAARETSLAVREAALRAVQDDLAAQAERLESLRAELEALVGRVGAEDEARFQHLVKVYENMKAKSAAAIFERLEMPVLLQVARRMREAKIAAILAAMTPERAKLVTAELAREKTMPRLD